MNVAQSKWLLTLDAWTEIFGKFGEFYHEDWRVTSLELGSVVRVCTMQPVFRSVYHGVHP